MNVENVMMRKYENENRSFTSSENSQRANAVFILFRKLKPCRTEIGTLKWVTQRKPKRI